jgi:putative transcriptional regulator
MKNDLFRELEASVREGGAILRGEELPSRTFVIEYPDVKCLRNSFQLSQPEFAAMLGISVKTLRNWEQGRRKPEGPARVLLQIAAKHPEAVLDVVRSGIRPAEEGLAK